MSALSFLSRIHAQVVVYPSTFHQKSNSKTKNRLSLISPLAFSDPFVLQLAETLEDSLPPSTSSPLQSLRDSSSETLLSFPWPSLKDEAFRFTDTSLIKSRQIAPVKEPPPQNSLKSLGEESPYPSLLIADGFVLNSVLDLADGVYAGTLSELPKEERFRKVFDYIDENFDWADLFWSVNGLGAPNMAVIYVPANVRVDSPVHLKYISVKGETKESKILPLSNARVLVIVEDGGELEVVEEFYSDEGDSQTTYWANAVIEIVVGKGSKISHSYLQSQSSNSAHTKWTSVRQEEGSEYEVVEVCTGGKLNRHNLHIQQLGADTATKASTFHLSVSEQTHDLHSKLVLDHPRGVSEQLHKCIVAHSEGKVVFDGNVEVNRLAQQTDAGQLTRSLLLEPRATVNLKPNLQIVADDVKCSHGAAISDLEEGQLFYFRARGIDLETARKALVFSFADEVVSKIRRSDIRKKVEDRIKSLLDSSFS